MNRGLSNVIVLIAGAAYVAVLLYFVKPGVFFSGDGGLKYLLVEQAALGKASPVVPLDAEPWVKSVWQQGFFPFAPPFVYPHVGGMLIAFPLYFSMVTAPFFRLFGYAGLYILPALAVVGMVWVLARLTRRMSAPERVTPWILVLFTFATPVTIYAAIYWEHAPAMLLASCALAYCIRSSGGPVGVGASFLLGATAGASVFLRPEAILVVGMGWLAAWSVAVRSQTRQHFAFLAGAALAVVGFLIANVAYYGFAAGAHSLQMLDSDLVSLDRLKDVLIIESDMLILLVTTMPFVLVLPFAMAPAWRAAEGNQRLRKLLLAVAAVSVAGILLTPFLMPNDGERQWGPRYLMPIVPWLVMWAGLSYAAFGMNPTPSSTYRWLRAAGMMALIAGVIVNVAIGANRLRVDYATRVYPALQFVKSDPAREIWVSNQFIPQEMATLFRDRNFFWMHDAEDKTRLLAMMRENGVTNVLYVTGAPDSSSYEPLEGAEPIGVFGSYFLERLYPMAPVIAGAVR